MNHLGVKMTESEYLALPDREKDTLIAEKVMGCKISDNCTELGQGHERRYPDAKIPNYSTSIEAAWEVVERMKDKPLHLDGSLKGDWLCKFDAFGLDAGGDTAPEAICLAALKAVKAVE